MDVDAIIFGGGSVGLWLLDELRSSGKTALLIENHELGSGQTISSQGIIHGGLKYTLTGQLTGSAQQIRDMPGRWSDSLCGKEHPDLTCVKLRSSFCYLWRTESLSSQLGMIGARIGLRVTPEKVDSESIPEFLDEKSAQIYKLPETVISPQSFIKGLYNRNKAALLKVNEHDGVEFLRDHKQKLWGVRLFHSQKELLLRSNNFIFTAGRGNETLREQAGLPGKSMQRRPLHMLMLKGNLPDFCGHCVDGAKTRVTITSERISPAECVWQVGGNIAEIGVKMDDKQLIRFGLKELQAVLPRMNWSGILATTYLVDRAEGKTALGNRPETPVIIQDENVITCWPTKLALVPIAVEQIQTMLKLNMSQSSRNSDPREQQLLDQWVKPDVSRNPWELIKRWFPLAEDQQKAAA